jgi:hypothetical protein
MLDKKLPKTPVTGAQVVNCDKKKALNKAFKLSSVEE